MVVNNLDNFSGNMANGLDSYFNQDGGEQTSVSIEKLTCEELSSMYTSLVDKMAVVSAESEGKQFIVDPLAQYQAELDLIMSRMVNMGCPIMRSDKVFRSLPPVEPDVQTLTSIQQAGVTANPALFQKNAHIRRGFGTGGSMHYTMHAVNDSVHTTANKGKGALGNIGNSIQKVGATAITLVNDALNGLFCGIGLTQLGNCKKDNVAVIRLDEGYSNAGGPATGGIAYVACPTPGTTSSCKDLLVAYNCWKAKYNDAVSGKYSGDPVPTIVSNVNYLATMLRNNSCGNYPNVSMPKTKFAGTEGVVATTKVAAPARASSATRQRFSNAGGTMPAPCPPAGPSCEYTLAAYKCWMNHYYTLSTTGTAPYSAKTIVDNVNSLAEWLKKNGCGHYAMVAMPVTGGGVKGGSINRSFPGSTTLIPAASAKKSSVTRQRFSNAAGSPCGCQGAIPSGLKNTPCRCGDENGKRHGRPDLFSNASGNESPCGCKDKSSGNNVPCPCMSGKPCPCKSGAPCGCQGKEKSLPILIKPVNNDF